VVELAETRTNKKECAFGRLRQIFTQYSRPEINAMPLGAKIKPAFAVGVEINHSQRERSKALEVKDEIAVPMP
jgi:hypothetical protein